MQSTYDVVIAGGGMVGASLALALANTDLRVALVEAVGPANQQQPSYDDRGLALSLSSRRVFEGLGIWQHIEKNSSPIRRVHVSDRGHFGKVRMDAAVFGLQALGHVVIARELGAVLMSQIEAAMNVDLICPAKVVAVDQCAGHTSLQLSADAPASKLKCKLLVVADGTHSTLREELGMAATLTDYGQTAIVSTMRPQLAHGDTAFERFTTAGPLALLPLQENRCVVVFTVPTGRAEYFLSLDDENYLAEVQQIFGRRLGEFGKPGRRGSYPLLQLQAEQQVNGRVVLLGNAAHTIHPNGAQGFNLCLRDVAGLAESLLEGLERGGDVGSSSVLNAYQASRLGDQKRVSRLSHGMTAWFYNDDFLRVALRNTALSLLDVLPPAKAALVRRGMGVSGRQPALVRGQAL